MDLVQIPSEYKNQKSKKLHKNNKNNKLSKALNLCLIQKSHLKKQFSKGYKIIRSS